MTKAGNSSEEGGSAVLQQCISSYEKDQLNLFYTFLISGMSFVSRKSSDRVYIVVPISYRHSKANQTVSIS